METDALQNLINRFKDLPIVERKPSFLDIARFPHRETVWRNIFAFFFDPKACHGFGDLFLRSFFDALGKQDQGTGDFDSMTVSTECQTEKGNFLDLLITCDEFAIGIEMKVNAGLYNDLEDYGKLITAHKPSGIAYKVVLSNAQYQPDAGFVNLRYTNLIPAIKQQLGNYVLAADPKYTAFLLDFLTHVTNYTGGCTMDLELLAFMKDNHKAVTALIAKHDEIHRLLVEKMLQISDAVVSQDSIKAHVVYLNRSFTRNGVSFSKIQFQVNGIGVWCEFSITPDCCLSTNIWPDDKLPEREILNQALKKADFSSKTYDLSKPTEDIVAAVGQMLLEVFGFLSAKSTPATAQ